jgi:hypothetical protein
MQILSILRIRNRLPMVSRVRRTLQVDHLTRVRDLISERWGRLEWSAESALGWVLREWEFWPLIVY